MSQEITMHARLFVLVGLIGTVLGSAAPVLASEGVTETLQRQTQELMDAITNGAPAVWERYLDANASYTSEDGTVYSKAQMVKDVKPLAKGVSGSIKVTGFKATLFGTVAIATHVDDE